MSLLASVKSFVAHQVGHGEGPTGEEAADPSGAAQEALALPNTHFWSADYATTTRMDPASGLLSATTAGMGPVPDDMTVYDIYADRARRTPDQPVLHFVENGSWTYRTGREILHDIRTTAKGFMHYGLKKGDAVAFMCRTSYEWDIV
ncbi:MAG: long-chain fatty acid--CoA ligase, partial [Bifidobacterium sp.]|nr:long-chain fatty acid--CoA ligase [Bifidobacterium sp.]